MREKWRDERGETLVEVVASILIMTLAILLLFNAVIVSVRINRNAKESDEKFYTAWNAAEAQGAGDKAEDAIIQPASKVTVTQMISPSGGTSKEVDVVFYGGEGALSYTYADPSVPAGP